jgi:hypothetical protein
VRWQDLRDAALRVGIFGADLTVGVLAASDLASSAAPAATCRVTGCARRRRTASTGSARRRSRAGARSAACATSTSCAPAPAASSSPPRRGRAPSPAGEGAPAERLRRAREMLSQGLISDAEYESIKARVVEAL